MTVDQNHLLTRLLPLLARYGVARRWSQSTSPYSDLERDCLTAVHGDAARLAFSAYLAKNPLVRLTVDSFLTHYSSAAFARAENVTGPARLLAQRGVYLGIWIPTFLVIDGPLSRFLRSNDSPLNAMLRARHADFPTLAQARDLLNHDMFRRVRNGIAHWSFAFEVRGGNEQLVCYDSDTGLETVALDVLEANALHAASLAIVDCLDNRIFRALES